MTADVSTEASRSTDRSHVLGGWRLKSLMVDGNRIEFAEPGFEAPWLGVGNDGRFNGRGPCNGYGGTLTIEADRLVVDGLGTDDAGCPNEDEDLYRAQEKFYELLDQNPEWHVAGRTLTLRAAGTEGQFSRGR